MPRVLLRRGEFAARRPSAYLAGMSVTRLNEFQAKPGQESALRDFLSALVPTIGRASGCRSCQLLAAMSTPGRFVVLEVWDSVEAHKQAANAIPASEIQRVMAMLAAPPKGEYFA